jgi:hypothetical protein
VTARWLLAVVAIAVVAPRPARADVERYALIVGNNAGDSDEQRLRYAEDDARRVYEVLRELGGFRPENMLLFRGEDAASFRRSLISLNDRIRTHGGSGGQAELLVYYSGHADQAALHLGRTSLELTELEQLVRGSAATLRVLILDACRSGALTRVKGGTIQPGFDVALDQRIPSDGVVFWTASAESENAQESDALGGSFFTHYLVSGLLGAADRDGDGTVSLTEAYQYAYDNTLRATSRTQSGTQHPTFHYELAGHADVALTQLIRTASERALVSFPDGKSYLLIQGTEDGAVVAEIGAHDRTRRLSVKPGRYFVRGRGAEFLLEGTLALAAGEVRQVREEALARIDYARLVRKGGLELRHTSSVAAGFSVRTSLWGGWQPCYGPFAGYALELPYVTFAPRIGVCRAEFADAPGARSEALDVQLRVAHAWDLGRVTLAVGGLLGGSYAKLSGSLRGSLREGLAHTGALTSATVDYANGIYSGIELDAMLYFYLAKPPALAVEDPVDPSDPGSAVRSSTPLAFRCNVVLFGKRW